MHKKHKRTRKEVGIVGENIASAFLERKGFALLERNYWKKWGEIDIIVQKGSILYFVEVKTISRENIIYTATMPDEVYMPEQNMHTRKIERLHRAIQSYLLEHSYDNEWQLDLLTVELFLKDNKAVCKMIQNVL